jgi:hypothetical protein
MTGILIFIACFCAFCLVANYVTDLEDGSFVKVMHRKDRKDRI